MLGIGMDRSLYYVLLQLDWPVLSIRKWFRWLETVAGTIARFNSLFRLGQRPVIARPLRYILLTHTYRQWRRWKLLSNGYILPSI
jgi:hypothetical protein